MIIINTDHLRPVLKAYTEYYNCVRTHLSLDKDAPVLRQKMPRGLIYTTSHLGGLHHEYARIE